MPGHVAVDVDGAGHSRDMGGHGLDVQADGGGSAAEALRADAEGIDLFQHFLFQIGVGIGGTFDKAALLAKKAIMRPLDTRNPDPFYADLEKEMLEKVNALGIGPQGFGGRTTAIGLNIVTMPTHIAGMPCAININCHVTRHKTEVL